ncbi:hypothetical protein EAH87_11990 [Sphingomonas koreensis]|nr:hypothetical protein EAH87_11990 [Sphingomonas koreensis]
MTEQSDQPTADDGVSKPEAGGRTGGGESGGGALKDPDQVAPKRGPRGRGGQRENRYYGPGDADAGDDNPNAVSDS